MPHPSPFPSLAAANDNAARSPATTAERIGALIAETLVAAGLQKPQAPSQSPPTTGWSRRLA